VFSFPRETTTNTKQRTPVVVNNIDIWSGLIRARDIARYLLKNCLFFFPSSKFVLSIYYTHILYKYAPLSTHYSHVLFWQRFERIFPSCIIRVLSILVRRIGVIYYYYGYKLFWKISRTVSSPSVVVGPYYLYNKCPLSLYVYRYTRARVCMYVVCCVCVTLTCRSTCVELNQQLRVTRTARRRKKKHL